MISENKNFFARQGNWTCPAQSRRISMGFFFHSNWNSDLLDRIKSYLILESQVIERAGWTRGGGTSVIPAARRAGATVRRHTTLRRTHSRTASHGTHSTPTNQRTTSADQRRFAGIATRSRRVSYCVAATTQRHEALDEKRYIEKKKKDSDWTTDFWTIIADQIVKLVKIDKQVHGYTITGSLSEIWLATVAVSENGTVSHCSHVPAAWHVL